MSSNPFDHMEPVHIDQVWDYLQERFGFPKKTLTEAFKKHLDKQPRTENDLGIFLKFGNEQINPILNDIFRRGYGFPTFNKLCEYIILKSPTYREQLRRFKNK